MVQRERAQQTPANSRHFRETIYCKTNDHPSQESCFISSLALHHRAVCLYQILGSWQFVSIVTGSGLILVVSGGPDMARISPNFVSFSIFTQFSAGLCPDRLWRTGSKTISISTMPSILSFNIVMTDQQNWASSGIWHTQSRRSSFLVDNVSSRSINIPCHPEPSLTQAKSWGNVMVRSRLTAQNMTRGLICNCQKYLPLILCESSSYWTSLRWFLLHPGALSPAS